MVVVKTETGRKKNYDVLLTDPVKITHPGRTLRICQPHCIHRTSSNRAIGSLSAAKKKPFARTSGDNVKRKRRRVINVLRIGIFFFL